MDQSLGRFRIARSEKLSKAFSWPMGPTQPPSNVFHHCLLTSMLHTGVSFLLSRDKDNIPVTHGEKRTRRDVVIDAAKNSFLRPLLQRGFSSSSSLTECQSPPHISITILPNPAGTGKQTHFPYEEETQSPTSCLSSSLPPSDPYLILNPARTPSSPSVRQSRSSRHITILSEPAREKQRAMEWGSTQSMQNVSAAGMRVPTIKPKSILKAPVPAPQPPALATDVKPSKSAIVAKARNLVVKVQLPKIVIHGPESYEARAETGVYHRAGTGTGTTNYGEMLGVLDVDSRSGLRQNDLARWYYPKKLAAEKIVRRLGSMVRKGSRIVDVRRRKPSRRYI